MMLIDKLYKIHLALADLHVVSYADAHLARYGPKSVYSRSSKEEEAA